MRLVEIGGFRTDLRTDERSEDRTDTR